MNTRKTQNSLLVLIVFGLLGICFALGVRAQTTEPAEPAGPSINKRPLVVFDQRGTEFDAPFLVEFRGVIGSDGKFIAKDSKFSRLEGNERSVEIAKLAIRSLSDSGVLQHLHDLSASEIVMILKQDGSVFSGDLSLTLENDRRALRTLSALNMLIQLSRAQKESREPTEQDKVLKHLLDNTRASADGSIVNVNVTLPKAVFHEMIKTELAKANKTQ